jgi:hypothetical protein
VSFNFPNSPVDGTVFTPSGGPTYTFSGGVWKLSGGGSGFVVVSDTPPATPFPGMLWWESDTGALWFWYVDANSSQWVQINFTPTGVATAETRNRLVNGAMQISQENGNTSVGMATGPVIVDQWYTANSTATVAAAVQRVQVTTPKGSVNRIRVTVNTGAAVSSGLFALSQQIEGIRVADFGWGTATAKQVIVRFGFKAPAGTYTFKIVNTAANRTYLAAFTIAAGQANADTEQVLVISGDVTGAWPVDNTASFQMLVVLAAGTTAGVAGWQAGNIGYLPGQSNGGATTGNIFELFDVGLYLDPLATGVPPAWTMPDEANELAACMRYWQLMHMDMVTYAPIAGTYFGVQYPFTVRMRTVPALSTATDGTGTNASSAQFDQATIIKCRALLQTTAIGTSSITNRSGIANARM